MSVTNENAKIAYVVTSALTYPVPFYFSEASHLQVFHNDTQITSGFTVSGAGNPLGGSITFSSALPSGDSLTILREIPIRQENSFNDGGPLDAVTYESMFDKFTYILQQLDEKARRALKLPVSSNVNPTLTGEVDPLSTLMFDETGENIVSGPLSTEIANAQGYALDALNSKNQAAISESNAAASSVNAANSANLAADMVLPIIARRLEYWAAKMAAGETVKIACFGDSTTDGNGTTGHTVNTFGSNHELDAPNAWPKKLQDLLREMYGNSNIKVWNAGFSGQRMDNGWAFNNYANAVINNPHYGVPDICFIGFGLNDINVSGSQINNHVEYTIKLVKRMIGEGTTPVLLTCDSHYRNNTRDHKESSRQIDMVKRTLAATLGIHLIDIDKEFKNWFSKNRDGFKWNILQPDALHFGDKGHAFKASVVARELFRDIVRVGDSWERLVPWDSRAAYTTDYGTLTTIANMDAGANINGISSFPSGSAHQTLWVWCDNSEIELIYRGITNESILSSVLDNVPLVGVKEFIEGSVTDIIPGQVGFVDSNNHRISDIPYRIKKLPFGLSQVKYYSGLNQLFYGNFEFWRTGSYGGKINNALKNIGYYQKSAPGVSDFFLFDEFKDGSNVYGLNTNQKLEMFIDASLPANTGIVIAHSQGWSPSAVGDNGPNRRTATVLFRAPSGSLVFYAITRGHSGVMNFSSYNVSSSVLDWSDNRKKLKVTIERDGAEQIVNVFEGWTSTSPVLEMTRTYEQLPVHFAGIVGGLYFFSSATGTAEIFTLNFKVEDKS